VYLREIIKFQGQTAQRERKSLALGSLFLHLCSLIPYIMHCTCTCSKLMVLPSFLVSNQLLQPYKWALSNSNQPHKMHKKCRCDEGTLKSNTNQRQYDFNFFFLQNSRKPTYTYITIHRYIIALLIIVLLLYAQTWSFTVISYPYTLYFESHNKVACSIYRLVETLVHTYNGAFIPYK